MHAGQSLAHMELRLAQLQLPGYACCVPRSWAELAACGAAGTSGPAVLWEDTWDAPGPRFEGFVEDCVRRRIGKYRQPAHPLRLSGEEALALFKKVRRVIVDTESKVRATPRF